MLLLRFSVVSKDCYKFLMSQKPKNENRFWLIAGDPIIYTSSWHTSNVSISKLQSLQGLKTLGLQ
jgi:hypothetical protein